MAQLHCYVPEEIAQQAQQRATQSGLSLSRYLAELVKRDAGASAHDATLITHSTAEFSRVAGLRMENWGGIPPSPPFSKGGIKVSTAKLIVFSL